MTRIYHASPILPNSILQLGDEAFNHVVKALRMQLGDELVLFDGSNQIFPAQLITITKKVARVQVLEPSYCSLESPLTIELGQVISRGEKMEFTIQKSVELGVNSITPLLSERCGVKVEQSRLDKKVAQWQKIAISACEQCGRNQIPLIQPVQKLADWSMACSAELKLNLNPYSEQSIALLPSMSGKISLLIGPEGGLTADEIALTEQHHFTPIRLGPRVLRTETAALVAITALQVRFGDLS